MASLFTKYKHLLRHSTLSTIANTSSIQSYLNISNTHFTLSKCRTFGFKPTQTDDNMAVHYLISVFTQQGFNPGNSVELSQLGFQLTPRIVEAVLTRLRSWNIAYRFFTWAKSQNGYFHNCYTYNAMASILSGARRNDAMKSLVSDVVNSSCVMSPGALGFLIRCLGSMGLVHEANELFDQVREKGLCNPNNYSYNCLLEAIAKSGLSDLAEKRLEEMRSFRLVVDKYTLTPLLAVYCNAREFEKAFMVFNEMQEKGWVDAHVLSILAVSFSKSGEIDKACELIERMEECKIFLNQNTFFVLVHGFVSSNRVDKALQLFDKMRGLGISPNFAVYDVLIGDLCSKDPQGALRLYSQMKSSGIRPNVGILNKLISCVTEEDMMVDLLEENGDVIHGESLRLLYVSVLNGLVSNDLVDRALGLVKMMMEDTSEHGSRLEKFFKLKGISCLDSSSFSIIINALCEKRRLDEAFELFKDMDRFGCPRDTTLYNNLIDALCYAERITDSLDLLNEMKTLNIQTTKFTYNSLYGYFCRIGDVKGATRIMKEMGLNRHEPWMKHSTTLVKQLCKQRRAMEVVKFLAEMVQEGLVPHIILYSAAIDELFKLQETDQALELFQIACSRGYKPDVVAYNILINGLLKANKMVEAENMLKEMLNGGLLPSIVTYNSLINGWCKNGDIDQALACLSKMGAESREPNIITYTTLVDGLCNAGRPDDALKLWNEMVEKSCSPNRISFMAIIRGLLKNNMPEMALSYLREMKKKELKADNFVYIALMDSLLLNKNPILAFEMLKEIAEMNMFPASIDKHHTLVKDAITKLADDPLTSCNVDKLIAERRIPMSLLCK